MLDLAVVKNDMLTIMLKIVLVVEEQSRHLRAAGCCGLVKRRRSVSVRQARVDHSHALPEAGNTAGEVSRSGRPCRSSRARARVARYAAEQEVDSLGPPRDGRVVKRRPEPVSADKPLAPPLLAVVVLVPAVALGVVVFLEEGLDRARAVPTPACLHEVRGRVKIPVLLGPSVRPTNADLSARAAGIAVNTTAGASA
jgi:hypothetical protein